MHTGDETQGGPGASETRSTEARDDPPAPATIGQIGRFVVLRRLGRGGMGVVYLAYDNDLDRKVALKLLRRRHADDRATTLRMQREAQAMARITHPNVLRVYEVGVDEGQIHVAMEYIEGETLRAWLARRGPPTDRAAVRELLAIFASAGAGLAAAHDAGLVHRDFKPDNVLLDARGGVHVADFGLARIAGELPEPHASGVRSALSLELTATRAALGTPAYMAPEQHAGLTPGVPADIFAFCVSLHEGLYGVRPFVGESVDAVADAAAREDVRPPPAGSAVPGWLRAVVLRGLRSDPEARWPSMQALLAALADDPIARRRRRLLAATGGLALVAAALLVTLWVRGAARQLDDQAAEVGEIRGERDEARGRADAAARGTRDLLRMAVLRDVEDDPTSTLLILSEVEDPAATPGWLMNAHSVLERPVSAAILRGQGSPVLAAAFVGDANDAVAVHTRDGHLRLHRRDGRGSPVDVDLGVGLPAMIAIDRARIAAPLAGERVGVWRVDPRAPALERVATLAGAPPRIAGLVRDPSGRRLVARGARSSRAVVWELGREEPVGELGCDESPIFSAEFSGDGDLLLLSSHRGTHCLHRLDGDAPPVTVRGPVTGDFLPDGDVVLYDDEGAALWRWRSGRRPRSLVTRDDVFRWDTDPSGRFIASVDFDGAIRLHPLDGGDARKLGSVRGADTPLFSDDGAWLAVIADRRLVLWRTDDLQRRAVLRAPTLEDLTQAFSDDGEWLLVAAEGDVHVWQIADLDRDLHIETDSEAVHGITPAPDGRAVAALAGGDVAWWQIPGDEAPFRRHALDWVFSPAVDDDARVAAISTTGRGDITVFADADARPRPLLGHRGPVMALDFSRDGRWLLSGSRDATARLWDLHADGDARVLVGHEGPIHNAALSDDAARAATLGADGSLRLWELRGAAPEREPLLTADRGGAHRLRFSPDGRWLVALTHEPAALLWDLDAGGPPRRLAHEGPPSDACWDPSGRWLATAAADGSARIWDPRGERPPLVHRDHGGPVTEIACSPDGRHIATLSEGRRVHLWPIDRESGAELHVVDNRVDALAFSRDGAALFIGTQDGVLTRWTPRFAFSVDADALLARLRAATTACLSVRQRAWLLRETPAVARERFEACERRFDRAP